jgi:microcystin-dependent protein
MKVSRYFFGITSAAFLLLAGVMFANIMTPTRTQAQLSAGSTWLGTAGGTANAIVIHVHNVAAVADLYGVPYRFLASAANTVSTAPATITYDLDSGSTLGPFTIYRPTSNISYVALSGGEITSGTITEITYSPTSGAVLTSAVDMTPIGSVVMSRVPEMTGYLVEDGSCYDQRLYAALFAVIGASYGNCGAGSFLVPDSRGTGAWATDNQGVNGAAGRLTTAVCGSPDSVGDICGANGQTLTAAQMPEVTSSGGGLSVSVNVGGSISVPISGTASGGISVTSTAAVIQGGIASENTGGGGFAFLIPAPGSGSAAVSSTGSASLSVGGAAAGGFAGTGSGGTSAQSVSCNNCGGQPFPVLPTVSLMYRLIKY